MNEGGVEGVGVGEILAEITEENGLEGGYAMREREEEEEQSEMEGSVGVSEGSP